MSGKTSKRQVDLEWERRVLCSDEACIGTIGTEGKCRECGKRYEGKLPDHFAQDLADEDASLTPQTDGDAPSDDPDAVDDGAENEADTAHDDDDWERRTLCSDESCIGVIGPDNRCKECGTPYKG